MLGGYGQATGCTLRATPLDVIANADHVAGWANDTATIDRRTLDVRAIVIFAMRDGKVTEAGHHLDDLHALLS
jgi:ketosteroid isomerase-like protein